MIRFFYVLIIVVCMIPSCLLASFELIEGDDKKHIVVVFNQLKKGENVIREVNSKSLSIFLSHDRLNLCKDLDTETDEAVSVTGNSRELFVIKIDKTSSRKKSKVQIFWKNEETLNFFIAFLKNFRAQFEKSRKNIRLLNIQPSIIEEVEPIDKLHLEEIKGAMPSIEKFRSHYSGIEIGKDTAVVSLRKTEWRGIPLASLIFERISSIENTLEFNCYTFLPQSTLISDQEHIKPFLSSWYSKGKGKIISLAEKQIPFEWKNEIPTRFDWKLDSFYIEEALFYINSRKDAELSFVFEPEYYSGKLKLPKNHYTSASFAAYVLQEYCYINGFEQEPFNSKLTVTSLMEVAQNVSPSSFQKPCEGEIGSLIAKLYSWIS